MLWARVSNAAYRRREEGGREGGREGGPSRLRLGNTATHTRHSRHSKQQQVGICITTPLEILRWILVARRVVEC